MPNRQRKSNISGEYFSMLENAVKDNPEGIVSRYILGRSYRKAGKYEDAIKIIEPVVQKYYDE